MNLAAVPGIKVEVMFATPILVRRIPDCEAFNESLARVILDHRAKEPGATKSNFGGWHSDGNMLKWAGTEVATLRGWIDDAIQSVSRVPRPARISMSRRPQKETAPPSPEKNQPRGYAESRERERRPGAGRLRRQQCNGRLCHYGHRVRKFARRCHRGVQNQSKAASS